MTSDELQLLREFRAEVPAPDETTRRRVYAYATSERTRLRGRRWRLPSLALAAGVVAAVVVVLLVSPWSGGGDGGLVQRALAAIGTGPVLHVVIEHTIPPSGYGAVSLPSGKPIQATERRETWFDQSRQLREDIATVNGRLIYRYLGTPHGYYIPNGNPFPTICNVYGTHTCVKINAQATGPNQPGPPPTLEAGLTGFIDHYRSALASGEATKTGTGRIDGHQVVWLHINADLQKSVPAEDVAIDASTYTPVLVRILGPYPKGTGPVQFRVIQIDTQAYDPSVFTPPARQYPPLRTTIGAPTPITATQAPSVLDGTALWLGQTWNGYHLVNVEKQPLEDIYAPRSGKQSTWSVGVVFTYAPPGGSADSPNTLKIEEATQCEMAWQMPCDNPLLPTEGVLILGQAAIPNYHTTIPSTTIRDGIYIAISQNSSNNDPVAVANALQPVTGN